MKKEIFKVGALGLVAVTLVTGCGKNEKENEMTGKEDFVSYEEKVEANSKAVVKVDIESEQLNDETVRLFVNATDITGKSVWTIELGNVPYGIGLENWLSYQGEETYYLSTNSIMSAYDIETGKKLWSVDRNFGGFIDKVEEKGNELHITMINPEGEGYDVKVINTKDGSFIKEYEINE